MLRHLLWKENANTIPFFTAEIKTILLTSSTLGGSQRNSVSKPHSFSYMLEVESFGVLDLEI